jgi:hypothetical protein
MKNIVLLCPDDLPSKNPQINVFIHKIEGKSNTNNTNMATVISTHPHPPSPTLTHPQEMLEADLD